MLHSPSLFTSDVPLAEVTRENNRPLRRSTVPVEDMVAEEEMTPVDDTVPDDEMTPLDVIVPVDVSVALCDALPVIAPIPASVHEAFDATVRNGELAADESIVVIDRFGITVWLISATSFLLEGVVAHPSG